MEELERLNHIKRITEATESLSNVIAIWLDYEKERGNAISVGELLSALAGTFNKLVITAKLEGIPFTVEPITREETEKAKEVVSLEKLLK